MSRLRVMSIFGTRPEAIKMAPLVKELEREKEIESIVCVTAQHREMLDQVLEVFGIIPDYDLDIMQDKQSITRITTRVLDGLTKLFRYTKPDLVLVHGDTTTTFAGALAAFYSKLMIGHVEAGLRTFNKYEPFPEELNRVLTSSLADLHFAPTETSSVSGQFKMDINGHEKSPQHGRVKEEKSSPTRIGLVSATNPPIRGVSKLEESGDHCEYTRVPRSGTDQESYSSALGA